ncbi:hypothetical protein BCR32DRAFT_270289 [Anaeromyces robustus]|uniref:Transcription regulator Rua1 C-terminal domain-containing protein n=1 Tax=Anaeromyces robustus TaxID=1754192 RepID=A0A1Y1WXG0_9FUNG|nr:hypothetical protein BCR32DRAFT_270289 [Anaeromyces robustus]|eukprot:ORX78008.1 hypothetical protein BCR32DRAFT_270289 [Anaeromyces robustus]
MNENSSKDTNFINSKNTLTNDTINFNVFKKGNNNNNEYFNPMIENDLKLLNEKFYFNSIQFNHNDMNNKKNIIDTIDYILKINEIMNKSNEVKFFIYDKCFFNNNNYLNICIKKTIIENYFKYCEIVHKTNIDIFAFFPNKEPSKFNLCIDDLKDIIKHYEPYVLPNSIELNTFIQDKLFINPKFNLFDLSNNFLNRTTNNIFNITSNNEFNHNYLNNNTNNQLNNNIKPYNNNISKNKNKINNNDIIKNKNNNKNKKIISTKKNISNSTSSLVIPKKPKHKYDYFTPRFVKEKGIKKIGKCPCCPQKPGTWYKTKTSAYRYHLNTYHGISSTSLTTYDKPSKYKLTFINELTKEKNEKIMPGFKVNYELITVSDYQDITNKLWPPPYPSIECFSKEGYCEKCNQWIKLQTNTPSAKKIYKYWWKHSKIKRKLSKKLCLYDIEN